ncbi:MAG: NUDIX domain-containing protein [Oscillospiraceae bacterium]|nr:NUDIX domain-containing protein [Oscillospiraceae bacterium]
MLVKKAGCILIDLNNKKIGIIHREKENDFSFPKGHLEAGETIEECALRETEEETGRKCSIIYSKNLPIRRYINSSNEDCELHLFLAYDKEEGHHEINENKHELIWKNIEEVKDILSYEDLKKQWDEVKPIVNKLLSVDKNLENRAGAIIPYADGIILMQRIKGKGEGKQEYYTIPGGGVEENESVEEAIIREIKEELGINIKLTDRVYVVNSLNRLEYYYIAEYVSGKIGTGQGEEMNDIDYDKYGFHNPMIVKKENIKNINLLPVEMKEIILRDMNKMI